MEGEMKSKMVSIFTSDYAEAVFRATTVAYEAHIAFAAVARQK